METEFVDRTHTRLKLLKLCLIDLDSNDVVPEFGKDDTCTKAHVPCADNSNLGHVIFPFPPEIMAIRQLSAGSGSGRFLNYIRVCEEIWRLRL
jgi:hypothetical protein